MLPQVPGRVSLVVAPATPCAALACWGRCACVTQSVRLLLLCMRSSEHGPCCVCSVEALDFRHTVVVCSLQCNMADYNTCM
eukprot:1161379-Pelagomonas_calceolata.AAC.10